MKKLPPFLATALLPLFISGCSALLVGSSSNTPDDSPDDSFDSYDDSFDSYNGPDPTEAPAVQDYYDAIDWDSYTTTYYIDPTAPDGGDGSQANPFDNWDTDVFAGVGHENPNTAYLFKRGTTPIIQYDHYFTFYDAENILIGAYGEGARPIFNKEIELGHCTNFTVVDLEITNFDYDTDNTHESSAAALAISNSENVLVLGSYFHHLREAFSLSDHDNPPNTGLKIIGNRMEYFWMDGIFGGNQRDIEIGYNSIKHVNQGWTLFEKLLAENDPIICSDGSILDHCPDRDPVARACVPEGWPDSCGGDSIQVSGEGTHIHHNLILRSTGNKFAILQSEPIASAGHPVIIEHNTIIGPLAIGGGAAVAIYGGSGDQFTLRYNRFLPPRPKALHFTNASFNNANIYGNIIVGGGDGISAVADDETLNINIFNNTFHELEGEDIGFSWSGSGAIKNNIFSYPASGKPENYYGARISIKNRPLATFSGGNNLFSDTFDDQFFISGDPNLGYDLETSDIVDDPLFVNAAENDFHLQSESPAINTGTMEGLPHELALDLDGTALPQDGTPDIGAFEYH